MPAPAKRVVEKRKANTLKVRPQVRKTFPAEEVLRSLGRSVITGQIHPLIILMDGSILDGECRWRGVMMEDPEHELDCILTDRELTPAEMTETQLVSDLHRNALTPHDQAVACRDWLELTGGTAAELAAKIDRDASMVVKLVSLFRTIPAVQQAAAEGKVGPKAWYQISLLPEADQQGLLEMYLSGMPASQVEQISRAKRKPAPAAKKGKAQRLSRMKFSLPEGVCMTLAAKKPLTIGDLIAYFGNFHRAAQEAEEQGLDPPALQAVLKSKARG